MAGWQGGRRPLDDEAEDRARRSAYWAWADARDFRDDEPAVGEPAPGVTLHGVRTHAQADFEAAYMRHSVGYDFDRYAGMGEILSLRRDGLPFVTALATGGVIVHAVRAANGIISDGDRAILQAVCDARGWTMPGNDALQGRDPEPDDGDGPGGPVP